MYGETELSNSISQWVVIVGIILMIVYLGYKFYKYITK